MQSATPKPRPGGGRTPRARRARPARASYVAQAGVIAAAYAAATIVCLLFMRSLAWGPVQFRISEALTVFALLTPAAAPGLTLGCVVANLANTVLSGIGPLGLLDAVFGSLATYLAARWMYRFRDRPTLAMAGPVVFNALIVPAYLPLLLMGLGFYVLPFSQISLDGVWWAMYLFGLVATGIGEAVVVYVLGRPLYRSLASSATISRLTRTQ